VEIRRFQDGDWPGLWDVWHAVVAAGDTYYFDPDTPEEQARREWLLPPPAETWVAVEGGTVLGTYLMQPNHGGLGDHVANAGFMVAPAARGRGLGRALAEQCLDRARAVGYSSMQFNAVVATNVRALALWRALGFIIVGTVPNAHRHPKFGAVDIHIMHRFL
jgi:GNAT superfamily N-acetyltransferase